MPKLIILMPSGSKFRKIHNLIIIIISCWKLSKFYAPVVLFSNYHTDMENVNRTRRAFLVTLLFVHPSPCIHAYKHRLHLVITQSFQIVSIIIEALRWLWQKCHHSCARLFRYVQSRLLGSALSQVDNKRASSHAYPSFWTISASKQLQS